MAGGLGEATSIIAVAELGLRLGSALYSFASAVKESSTTIKIVCSDVNAIAGILHQLEDFRRTTIIVNGSPRPLLNEKISCDIQNCSTSCQSSFNKVEQTLTNASEWLRIEGVSRADQLHLSTWEKLRWPLIRKQLQEIRGELGESKATLSLSLNFVTLRAVTSGGAALYE